MRFAAIADIHGNCAALEAVLADIHGQGITDIVNLGDSLSGPLEAGRTADLLLLLDTMSTVTVRGNHDRYLIESPADAMPPWEQHAFSQLAPRHLQWLRKLPLSAIYCDEAYLCHATPQSDSIYWLEQVSPDGHVFLKPLEEIEALAAGIEQALILCGHSHIPRAVHLSDGRLIVNPGSVGCPAYDDDKPCFHKVETGNTMASYAVMEKTSSGWVPQFRNVAYDNIAMARLAAENGRADWSVALATGRTG